MIIAEASDIAFPVGFWPEAMKCPECKIPANREQLNTDGEGDVTFAEFYCDHCGETIRVFND